MSVTTAEDLYQLLLLTLHCTYKVNMMEATFWPLGDTPPTLDIILWLIFLKPSLRWCTNQVHYETFYQTKTFKFYSN